MHLSNANRLRQSLDRRSGHHRPNGDYDLTGQCEHVRHNGMAGEYLNRAPTQLTIRLLETHDFNEAALGPEPAWRSLAQQIGEPPEEFQQRHLSVRGSVFRRTFVKRIQTLDVPASKNSAGSRTYRFCPDVQPDIDAGHAPVMSTRMRQDGSGNAGDIPIAFPSPWHFRNRPVAENRGKDEKASPDNRCRPINSAGMEGPRMPNTAGNVKVLRPPAKPGGHLD